MSGYFHVFQKYPTLRRINNIVANTGWLVGVGVCTVLCVCVYANTEEINNQYCRELFLFKLSLHTNVETVANTRPGAGAVWGGGTGTFYTGPPILPIAPIFCEHLNIRGIHFCRYVIRFIYVYGRRCPIFALLHTSWGHWRKSDPVIKVKCVILHIKDYLIGRRININSKLSQLRLSRELKVILR